MKMTITKGRVKLNKTYWGTNKQIKIKKYYF